MAAEFCGSCGARFPADAKWCPECGAKRDTSSPSARANAHRSAPAAKPQSSTNWPLIAAGLVIPLAIIAAVASGVFSPSSEPARVTAQSEQPDAPPAAADEGPSAREKLADYEDRYLSAADTTLYVTQAANVRDYPAPEGSKVIASLAEGDSVTGRWVRGVTPNTRWLRYTGKTGASYVWEGALSTERPFSVEDYRDTFLSVQTQTLVATGPANVRSFPGPDVGKVYYQLQEGDIIRGRWVRGIDPEQRYLKIETRRGPAYVWEDNLQ